MFATLSKSHSRLTVACKQPVRYYRNIVKLFSDRGLLQDVFPKEKVSNLVQMIEKKSVGVYAGFDPTADSLHIGNLLVLMGLLHAQRSGLKPVAVIGGATGRIGDPSGKSSERPVLASETLDNNIKGVRTDIQKIFSNHEKYLWHSDKLLEPVTIVNNEQFYSDIKIVDFVTDVGRHFRMGSMLSRHSVKSRIESEEGMSFTEFTYQTFQAYDWLRLCKEYECYIQLGGSDQMGNIVSGQDLISRKLDKSVYGVTMPLVVSESGDKFGKSSGTPVWINELKTTPYEVYQYMLRQKDSDIQKMLKLFTFLPLPEVEAIVKKHEAKPEARYGQERLAEQITLLLHGPAGLKLAESSTQIFFKNDINALAKLSTDESRAVFQQADYIQKLFSPGITVYDFALSIGCFKWDRDALRIIAGGGFYINQVKITNPDEVLVHGIHILENDLTLVRVGKKHYYLVEWVNS